ncbi:MerR family transcriptional regulator [Pacificimonas sp. WHA3]|uniref:MerR family transcriptional regulator n=1 Tax=Pacificimonas pallii TaxID=2827236 RepID=A0ABS6SBH0_9SPHN|nr:MerR family transcriptional regulator [Pacificimonas pallii]MBV7255700.1 MerR family transcriptional regulator [Pacificimonas pallii]
MAKSADAFRTISEVSKDIGAPQHVLRFWETKFKDVSPLKRGGGRRYYRPDDVALIRAINHLLYTDGYTIKGVQKLLKEQGVKAVIAGGPANSLAASTAQPAAAPAAAAPMTSSASGTPATAPVAVPDRQMIGGLTRIRDRLKAAATAARAA